MHNFLKFWSAANVGYALCGVTFVCFDENVAQLVIIISGASIIPIAMFFDIMEYRNRRNPDMDSE